MPRGHIIHHPGEGPPLLPLRTWLLANLHRPPCRWDVLIAELAEELLRTHKHHRRQMQADTFRFTGQDRIAVGWMLARGFEVWVVETHLLKDRRAEAGQLWRLAPQAAGSIARDVAASCFDPLLRKYVEETQQTYPGRPHRDLDSLLEVLGQALQSFLVGRCLAGGDLHDCLTKPLDDAGGYFGRSVAPGPIPLPASSGNPLLDVYNLGPVIHDVDGPADLKRTLVWFARHDPWLFAECLRFVQDRVGEQDKLDAAFAADDATDEFIYRATHLAGRSPIELLIDRQLHLADHQRQRLLRWDRRQFTGLFLVKAVRLPFVEARDLELDRDLTLEATKPENLHDLREGELLVSRVVPWDDHWLLSGIQQQVGRPSPRELSEIAGKLARRLPLHRLPDDDIRVQRAFAVQAERYNAWLALFGSDEMVFRDGLDLGAALDRFEHHWSFEMVLPHTGQTRAQGFQQRHGRQPPVVKMGLPEDLLKAKDIGLVFHARHGMTFLPSYGLFRSAFDSEGQLRADQVGVVWQYLTDQSIDYWVLERMRDRHPARTQAVLRQVLKDQQFQLDRDFGPTLAKFKGQQLRRPPRPMVSVLDDAATGALLRSEAKP